jgi:hypothetical protein
MPWTSQVSFAVARPSPLKAAMRSWFAIDGTLPEIDYSGNASNRFPEQLVERMVECYSRETEWVLDPFCGFGTTLAVCARMNRNAIGFEKDAALYSYTQQNVKPPCAVNHDRAENIGAYPYPKFQLLLTSPPFRSFRGHPAIDGDIYYRDLVRIFQALRPALAEDAYVVVESVNLLGDSGAFVPRAFHSALALASVFRFEREIVCCNTGNAEVSPGYQHSYLLIFRNATSQG